MSGLNDTPSWRVIPDPLPALSQRQRNRFSNNRAPTYHKSQSTILIGNTTTIPGSSSPSSAEQSSDQTAITKSPRRSRGRGRRSKRKNRKENACTVEGKETNDSRSDFKQNATPTSLQKTTDAESPLTEDARQDDHTITQDSSSEVIFATISSSTATISTVFDEQSPTLRELVETSMPDDALPPGLPIAPIGSSRGWAPPTSPVPVQPRRSLVVFPGYDEPGTQTDVLPGALASDTAAVISPEASLAAVAKVFDAYAPERLRQLKAIAYPLRELDIPAYKAWMEEELVHIFRDQSRLHLPGFTSKLLSPVAMAMKLGRELAIPEPSSEDISANVGQDMKDTRDENGECVPLNNVEFKVLYGMPKICAKNLILVEGQHRHTFNAYMALKVRLFLQHRQLPGHVEAAMERARYAAMKYDQTPMHSRSYSVERAGAMENLKDALVHAHMS